MNNIMNFGKAPTLGLRIVCAACVDSTGKMILGVRHFDHVMKIQMDQLTSYTAPWTQGFLDNSGNFQNRQEAWKTAYEASQIIRDLDPSDPTLYSENLY